MKRQNFKMNDEITVPSTGLRGGEKQKNVLFSEFAHENAFAPKFKAQSAKIRPKKHHNPRENEMPPFQKPRITGFPSRKAGGKKSAQKRNPSGYGSIWGQNPKRGKIEICPSKNQA